MAGRIGAGEKWEVKDRGIGGLWVVMGFIDGSGELHFSKSYEGISFNHEGHQGHKDEESGSLLSLCSS